MICQKKVFLFVNDIIDSFALKKNVFIEWFIVVVCHYTHFFTNFETLWGRIQFHQRLFCDLLIVLYNKMQSPIWVNFWSTSFFLEQHKMINNKTPFLKFHLRYAKLSRKDNFFCVRIYKRLPRKCIVFIAIYDPMIQYPAFLLLNLKIVIKIVSC